MKKRIINIGILCISIATLIVFLEFILRFIPSVFISPYKPSCNSSDFRFLVEKDQKKGYDFKKNMTKMDAYVSNGLAYELKYEIWSNHLGCFDMPYHGEKKYILLLGDSFTTCFSSFNDMWGTKVEALLGIRVLKCGVVGYATRQELIKAEEIISKVGNRPNLIVVGYFLDDVVADWNFAFTPNRTNKPHTEIPNLKKWLTEHSCLYNLTRERMRSLLLKLPSLRKYCVTKKIIVPYTSIVEFYYNPDINAQLTRNCEDLKTLKNLAYKNNAEFLVVIIPLREQVYPFLYNWNGIDYQEPNRLLHKIFEKERIRYIDLLPLFKKYANQKPRTKLDPKNDLFWQYDRHWNVKGNHLASLLVSEYILQNNLVKIAGRSERLVSIREKLNVFH
jgi:hypothetical protein